MFRIEVNHVKSGFFFASKRNEIFASISNFASEAKVRAHPSTAPTFNVPKHLCRVHALVLYVYTAGIVLSMRSEVCNSSVLLGECWSRIRGCTLGCDQLESHAWA